MSVAAKTHLSRLTLDRSNRYGELFTALKALVKAGAVRLALNVANALVAPAMRAYRPIGPADGFKVDASGCGVVEAGFFEGVFGHGFLSGMDESCS
jgi:hypothetical protein